MNTKTEAQIARMKTQTIGYEVEMTCITRKEAARIAVDYFSTGRYEYRRYGYSTWSAWDAQGREWKFMNDSSIRVQSGEACELVTPILHYEDIPLLQEVIQTLRKEHERWDRNTCAECISTYQQMTLVLGKFGIW